MFIDRPANSLARSIGAKCAALCEIRGDCMSLLRSEKAGISSQFYKHLAPLEPKAKTN